MDCSGLFLLQRCRTDELITLTFCLAGLRRKSTAAVVHKKTGLSRGALPSLCPWTLRNNTLRGWGFDCAGCACWISTHIQSGKRRQTHFTKIIPLDVVWNCQFNCVLISHAEVDSSVELDIYVHHNVTHLNHFVCVLAGYSLSYMIQNYTVLCIFVQLHCLQVCLHSYYVSKSNGFETYLV